MKFVQIYVADCFYIGPNRKSLRFYFFFFLFYRQARMLNMVLKCKFLAEEIEKLTDLDLNAFFALTACLYKIEI